MIANATDIMHFQRVEAGMPAGVIDRVIAEVNGTLQQCVGPANYATLDAMPATAAVIVGGNVGGEYFEGLVPLVSEAVFALLCNDRLVVTGFGTVIKRDEYSEPADHWRVGSAKYNHFLSGVQHLCRLMGWRYTAPANNLYNEHLL